METLKLLKQIEEHLKINPEDDEMFVEAINEMLDDLLGQDAFGTEGQCDPRGDHRNY